MVLNLVNKLVKKHAALIKEFNTSSQKKAQPEWTEGVLFTCRVLSDIDKIKPLLWDYTQCQQRSDFFCDGCVMLEECKEEKVFLSEVKKNGK